MPRYVYRCTSCEQDIEAVQSLNDKPLKRIPMVGPCGEKCKSPVVRVFSTPNVNLHQGQAKVTRDENKATIVEHWDGRQDVTVRPDVVSLKTKVKQGAGSNDDRPPRPPAEPVTSYIPEGRASSQD